MVSTSHLKLCHTPNVVPALPHWCSLPPGPVGLSGLPPCCPIGPASTPPAQSCSGGGGTTWLATPPTPTWGRVRQAPWSCNTFTSLSGGTCSTFTSHSGGTPFHPVPPHPPPLASRHKKHVHFCAVPGPLLHAAQLPLPPKVTATAPPGTVFPGSATRVFAHHPAELLTSAGLPLI